VVIQAHQSLTHVRAPALVIQSRDDNRISRKNAAAAFARLGSAEKELVWTDGAGHVICVDFGREGVFELTASWLEKYRPR
jgi:esterase/lipase